MKIGLNGVCTFKSEKCIDHFLNSRILAAKKRLVYIHTAFDINFFVYSQIGV